MEITEVSMNISNEEIKEVFVEVPGGHRHVRTRISLQDGTELVFQEAAMANIVRAFITVKTHPEKTSVRLRGRKSGERKPGYAEWQLIED
jgi:hypothetical protein